MKRINQIFNNKTAYLRLSLLEVSFMVYMKTEGIYVDITKDVETRFYIANYKLEKAFSKGKSKIVTRSMKDELRII